jgi:tetratricopeptide (TPR) repeat protein
MKSAKVFLFFLVFFLSFSLVAQNSNSDSTRKVDPEIAEIVKEGDKLLKTGNFNGAVEKYEKALESQGHFQIYSQLGKAYIKLKKYDKAIGAFQKAVEDNPEHASAYNLMGRIQFALKKYDKAIENLETYVNLVENKVRKEKANEIISKSYYNLGSQKKEDGAYEQAVELLQNSADINNYDLAHFRLAETHYELGNYDKAIEHADKALNYRKTVSKGGPYYFKGMAFLKKGDTAKAKEAFELGKDGPQYGQNCKHQLEMMN